MDNSVLDEVTAAIARSARSIRYEQLPDDVVFLARQCALDWFGVALAGADEPLARILRDEAAEAGGNPQATLVGSGTRTSLQQAALINGAASHALDFDDVQMTMSGHPSVPVIPALLALAEQRGASGRDFIASFVAGFEVECRIGALVMPGHYTAGWHATGTLGTFGAAAACAHLMGLTEEQWLHALGIAGAQAAGLKSMFGTMCKPLHAGKAASNGLFAAQLAARGFTSNPGVLEVPQGFTTTQTTTPNPGRALQGLGEEYAIRGVLFKYHAACYGTHETIEGVLRLRRKHGLKAADVRQIRLTVPAGNLAMCNIQEPTTALEGKFSLRFTAALALAGDDTSEAAFTDAAVREPALVSLGGRVVVEGRTDRARAGTGIGSGTDVTITTADGTELREFVNLETPADDLSMQWERLEAKFLSLATPVLGGSRAAWLRDRVSSLEDQASMADVVQMAVAREAAAV
ncbi:MAG: MmgE/PrpD family protein [Anaerolinea sp.]|nr:MmgE/PrpD family protein [Anaerolinea sp.]